MGADKNSLRRELGLYPKITSKRPPQVLSRSRSNQDATDPRNNTLTQVLETRSGTTNSGTQASTGQTGHQHQSDRSKAGHTSGTRRVTRPSHAGSPAFTQRQIGSPVQPTPGHPSNSCDFPRKSQHRSGRCRAPVRLVPGHLPKTCPELVQQA